MAYPGQPGTGIGGRNRGGAGCRARAGRLALRLVVLLGLLGVLPGPTGLRAPAAAAEAFSTAPVLRIETGVHGARINRLVVDPSGARVVTVSDDKTARIWSLADGKLLETVRVPIGDGPEGRLHAAALSPNGKILVVGGFTGLTRSGTAEIYLYGAESAGWIGNVGFGRDGTAAVRDMRYLPDGRLLVALDDASGLRVVDFAARKIDAVKDDLGGAVLSLDVAADGRVVAAAQDGTVRLYDPALKRIARLQLPSGQMPFGVAFDPGGSRVAVGLGGASKAGALLLDADGLKKLADLEGGGGARRGGLALVAWSADGKTVYGAGSYADDRGTRLVRSWPIDKPGDKPGDKLGAGIDIPVGVRDIVTDLRGLPGGGVVFATADPAWGTMGAGGRLQMVRERQQADFRDGFDGCFAVSQAGDVVEFGVRQGGRDCVRFDLTASELDPKPKPRADLSAPRTSTGTSIGTSAGSLRVTDWRNAPHPAIYGKPVSLDANELARSVAVAADGKGVAIGTDFAVRFHEGTTPAWKTEVPSPAWLVAISGDGRLVIAGLGDGSIRWLKRATGEPVVSLFVAPNENSWVLWTPEGLYDYGKSGESLIGYHRNLVTKGRPAGTEFVDVGQIYSSYYRRDLVKRKFRGEGEADIAAYLARIGDAGKVLDRGLPPRLRLLAWCTDDGPRQDCHSVPAPSLTAASPASDAFSPAAGGGGGAVPHVATPTLRLRVEAEDRGGGLGEIQILRNAVPVPFEVAASEGGAKDGKRTASYVVQLVPGENHLAVRAKNDAGEISSAADEVVGLTVTAESPEAAPKPRLRLISVGVGRFGSPELTREHTLEYAVPDAKAVVEIMQSDKSLEVYESVDAVSLLDKDATLQNIRKAFHEVSARTEPGDVGLIFLAGYGATIDGKYYFLPYDLRDLTDDGIRDTALTHEDLAGLLRDTPATRILVAIDPYFSGAFDTDLTETATRHLVRDGGRDVLASGTSEDEATSGVNNHGVFASVLLDALSGKADLKAEGGNGDNRVDVLEVSNYSVRRVPEAAARAGRYHQQEPVFASPSPDEPDDYEIRNVK